MRTFARRHPDRTELLAARGRRPAVELCDLESDPDCIRNLATAAATAAERDTLKASLYAALRAQEDPRMYGRGEVFDRHPGSNPANARFYERYTHGERFIPGWVQAGDFEPNPID